MASPAMALNTKYQIAFSFPGRRLRDRIQNAAAHLLEEASDVAEKVEFVCGGFVIAGLVAEFLIALAHPKYSSFPERWGGVIADFFVAIGVVGEIAFSQRAKLCEGELTRRSNERLADAERRAGDAAERAFSASTEARLAQMAAAGASTMAGNAIRELAVANERAAKLEKKAAEARERAAEIERLAGWRQLEPGQRQAIIDAVGPTGGANIRLLLEFQATDPEAYIYGRDIYLALSDAGITISESGGNSYLSGTVFDVHIEAAEPAKGVAEALSERLGWPLLLYDGDSILKATHERFLPNLYIFVGTRMPPHKWTLVPAEELIGAGATTSENE